MKAIAVRRMAEIMKAILMITILLLSSAAMAETVVNSKQVYLVEKGDYLCKIAQKLGVDWKGIAQVNGIAEPWIIHPGQKLVIPQKEILTKKAVEPKAEIVETNSEKGQKIYSVQPGDSLYKIGRQVRANWEEIALANKIIKPWIIYPKQKLVIPQNVWRKVGGNPYKGTWQWALDQFNLPPKIKSQVKNNIESNRFQWLENGLRNGQVVDSITFGKNEIWDNVKCSWFDDRKAESTKDYGVGNIHVLLVFKCGNWVLWKEKPGIRPIEKKSEKKVDVPPVPVYSPQPKAKFPSVPLFEGPASFPPVPVYVPPKKGRTIFSDFDLLAGGGKYRTIPRSYDAKGHYYWTKGRWRFLSWQLGDDSKLLQELQLGLFGFAARGRGNDEAYNYRWSQLNWGLTGKLIGPHWDADIDLGIWGKLKNEGGSGLYRSEQVDSIHFPRYLSAHLNLYGRRDKGEKWLPKTEFNAEMRWAKVEAHNHYWDDNRLKPDPNDNRTLAFSVRQAIYDFEPTKHFRVTPEFNLVYSREYGYEEPNFLQIGPSVTLGWYNQDIISVSVFNYKRQLGGPARQLHPIAGWISLSGIIKAIHASQIKEAKPEDLKVSATPDQFSEVTTSDSNLLIFATY